MITYCVNYITFIYFLFVSSHFILYTNIHKIMPLKIEKHNTSSNFIVILVLISVICVSCNHINSFFFFSEKKCSISPLFSWYNCNVSKHPNLSPYLRNVGISSTNFIWIPIEAFNSNWWTIWKLFLKILQLPGNFLTPQEKKQLFYRSIHGTHWGSENLIK